MIDANAFHKQNTGFMHSSQNQHLPNAKHGIALRLILALGVSLVILALAFHFTALGNDQISAARVLNVLSAISMPLTLASLACMIAQTLLRAWRYRLLLQADGHARLPRFLPLLTATAARNMFIDLLPARLGEFSYVALLNRGCGVAGSACVSSMALSLFLDFLALFLLIMALAAWLLISSGLPGWLLTAMLALVALIAVMIGVLFWGIRHAANWFENLLPRISKLRPVKWCLTFARELADSLERARKAGLLLRALTLSIGVRLFKYIGFYILFLAVTKTPLPAMAAARPFEVIFALLSAEAAASMPLPSFMSFGTYETGGLLCLVALGYTAADSMLAMFSMHIVSQIMDYAFGCLGLALFFLLPNAAPAAQQTRDTARRKTILLTSAGAILLLAAALATGMEIMRLRKLGSLRPPEAGAAADMDESETARTGAAVADLKGFVAWSSNRAGNHDIWKLSLPEMTLSQLTTHPHAEYFPRISPDGGKLAFCRAQIPWVSQRDPLTWDVFIMDISTGAETFIASNAVAPSWSPDGKRLFFQRNATTCVERDMISGRESTLFDANKLTLPKGTRLETPSINSKTGIMAVTLRGASRALALIEPAGNMARLGDKGKGCQLFWAPDETFLYFTLSHGGNMGNRFMRYDPQTRATTELFDMPGNWSHEYFPKLSADGRVLVFGACAQGHEHDTADYEIFLWKTNTPPEAAVRLTWHTGNDNWPDIFLEPLMPQ